MSLSRRAPGPKGAADKPAGGEPIVLHLGTDELVIRRRYETLSIINDVMIGLVFLVGSFLFFSGTTMFAGTVLFVLGSVEMLIRPAIRLARQFHLQKIRTAGSPAAESDLDF